MINTPLKQNKAVDQKTEHAKHLGYVTFILSTQPFKLTQNGLKDNVLPSPLPQSTNYRTLNVICHPFYILKHGNLAQYMICQECDKKRYPFSSPLQMF